MLTSVYSDLVQKCMGLSKGFGFLGWFFCLFVFQLGNVLTALLGSTAGPKY